MDYDYMARERALQMAQSDWNAGVISESQVIVRVNTNPTYPANLPRWHPARRLRSLDVRHPRMVA